jgi:predicted lipoprotein with Yx(FWY)xxD motif
MHINTTVGITLIQFIATGSYAQKVANMPVGVKVEKTSIGNVFANSSGMTLYTF